MSTDVETGATFTVRAGATTVFTGSVGSDLGKWSKTYTHVYPLDFDALATAGTYTIEVAGPLPASSPTFRIATGTDLYAGSLDQRVALLRQRARRRELHPVGAANGARAPERQDREDLPHPERELERPLQGRPLAAGGHDRRVRRLVGRGRLHQVRPDDELHGRHAACRRPRLPGADGRGIADLELHRGVAVRRAVPPAPVERQDLHALLPGGDRLREREHHRRPRHLAASARRRHVRRHRPAVPVHPQPPGLPRGAGRRADQPESRRTPGRGVRGMLTGLPRDQHEAREPMPARGCAHLRPGRHRALG